MQRFIHSNIFAVVLLGLLALAFGLLAYASVLGKSATADEPLHIVSAYTNLYEHDFRVDPEDPPLFKYWAMIPNPRGSMRIDHDLPAWDAMLGYMWSQWRVVIPTLYRTPGVDPEAIINRSRAMMTILGIVLASVIAWWAWDLAGPWAALMATALYCFDPNFLAHAPLVKNDVPIALILCALSFAIYRAGQRMTMVQMLTIALLTAAAVTTKFSGLLIFGIAAIVLISRALMDRPWLVFGSILADRLNKLGAAAGTIALSLIISYFCIWACYGFRYAPTPDQSVRLNTGIIVRAGVRAQMLNRTGEVEPSSAALDAAVQSPPAFPQMVLWADEHRILPHAWLVGLLDTWATTQRRPTFLAGQYSWNGWWYYFPAAMVFKTPLATLATFLLTICIALRLRILHQPKLFDRWTFVCIAIPLAVYGISAMSSNLNLGLRHVLPLYPLLYVVAGATIARALLRKRSRAMGALVLVLFAGLVSETLAASPDYIAFFNIAAGGSRGGFRLLGDSNLDWGQDLNLLRDWQHQHPNTKLIISYFGGADWEYYVKGTPMISDEMHAARATTGPAVANANDPSVDTVLAISATNLQGIYPPQIMRSYYQELTRHKLLAVLGGTIYLYRLPLSQD